MEPYSIRACRDCGLTENDLGSDHVQAHEPELLPGLEPTCYEPGYQDYVICSVCGAELNKTELAPLEHNILYRAITETTHVEYCHRRGCDYESGPIGHIHTGWTQTQAPTCETDGREEAVCACGHRKSRIIKAPGHTKVTDPAVAPTCTEEGLTEGAHCGVCGRILAVQQPVAATGHTFDQKKTTDTYKAAEATCTEPETYYYSCICGAKGTETFRFGALADHRFDQQKATDEYRAAEATCTEAATYYMSCICGEKGTQTFRYGDPVPHTPGAPADCVHAQTCTVCGTVLERAKGHVDGPVRYDEKEHWTVCGRDGCGEILRRDGHTGRWLVEESSTCVTRGTEVYRCGCGYENTRKLELADHDHSGDWQSDGRQHYRICPDCGQSIDAADHRGGEYQPDHAEEQHCRICTDCGLGYDYGYHIPVPNGETKAPTCTEEGYTPYRCELCGWEWKGDVVSAGGHQWSDTPDFDEQYHFNVCSVCGKQDLNNREKHTLDEGEVIREATCTEPGIVRFGCVFCDYEEEKSKDPDHDHSGKWVNTESGQHYRICGICNEPIDHEAHKLKTDPHEPDCENPGYDQHTCTDCGYSFRDNESEALGHSGMDEWQIDKRTGEHYRACDRDGCGYEADRAGHAYGAWRTIVEPTCREFGKQEHSCEVCGHTESDDINKLPHDTYETVETTPKPVSGGTVYEHALVERCRNCDYSQKLGENCVSVHDTLRFRNEVPATCTEPGLTTGWECAFPGCDNSCHDRQQKPIPALGHDFLDGWCTRCGAQSASEGLEFTLSDDGTYYIVTGIGTCTDTELVIPGTHQGLPVREIGDYAFYGCSGLESIMIPEGVTAIGIAAFSRCSDLAQVTLPKGLTTIGDGAFGFCTSLRTITIPQGVTTIGNWVLENCSGLEKIELPKGVTTIGDFAFQYCSGLTVVTMPARVTRIGVLAFLDCTALETIYFEGTQAQWDAVEKRSGWNDGCPAQVICLGGAAASQGMGSPGSKDRGPRVGACSMDCAP